MKFICEKNSLQEAVSTAQKAVTGKSNMTVLEGLLIIASNNEITIIGSDKDLSIETKIKAEIIEEGSIVVDSKLFGEIIRKMPNYQIELNKDINGNSLEITCKKSKAIVKCMNEEDYPSLPYIEDNININISQGVIKNMIRGTIFSVAQDEIRPILTGVLLEIKNNKINFVALDGLRLALRYENIDSDTDISVVIPGKTLNEISKILSDTNDIVNITFTQNQVLFNLGNTKVISRLLEGEYIKYNSIIPYEHKLKVIVKKDEILESIERASLVARETDNNFVKLDMVDDLIVITSNSQLGNVREEVNAIMQGEEIHIAFNSKYLIDVLKNLDEEEIIMELTSSISPCILKNKQNDNSIYLVLPVRFLNA